jgi:DNA-binding NtrC family response regulator
VKTRIVAATNRNLLDEVKAGRFREDLYFRLSVLPFRVPCLRERPSDIPLLVKFFLEKFNKRFDRNVGEPTVEAMSRLIAYDWPGNVRELQNSIERGVVLATNGVLKLEDMFFNASEKNHDRLRIRKDAGRPNIRRVFAHCICSWRRYFFSSPVQSEASF